MKGNRHREDIEDPARFVPKQGVAQVWARVNGEYKLIHERVNGKGIIHDREAVLRCLYGPSKHEEGPAG